ncbi:hypothetical protein OAS67_09070 [Alphaproteobacteria bacterium]|nr:hypothetical protein [Alphaproteobacteria bacterium]
MNKNVEFNALGYAKLNLTPILNEIICLSEKYGNMDQITYFLSIKNEILSASQTDDLMEIFFHLSSANFLGFDYPSDVTVLLNDLLDKSILLSETQNAKIDGVN